ncbi:MAG TPA: site-2 protease family protein [Ktedonobacteraceae bacterium]|jgi:Zn-dependent protease|nr:site-2 protease family protein [Ktedonobacteraceae bacterium]
MSWKPGDFSEYSEMPADVDYSSPAYYEPDGARAPRSAQPVQSLQPLQSYPDYDNAQGPTLVNGYNPAPMTDYRGPTNLEGYTVDAGQEQREAAKRGTASDGKKRKGLAGLGGIGASIIALLLKFKTLLLLLFDFKWLAFFAKFGLASITALISIAAYAWIFGWPFAIGLVALLFIHEMGHALVMKMKGMPIGGVVFIPLLGAAVFMRQMPKNAKDEAEVGIAGPIAGAIASSICLFLAQLTPGVHTIWAPLAYFGFFINLFNLIPIVPFDGGRVLAAIDRRIWIIGFLGLLAFEIWSWFNGNFSIWLLFFIFMAGSQLWARRHVPNTPEARAYYSVPVFERVVLSLAYFGLAAVLVLGMSVSHGLIFGLGY